MRWIDPSAPAAVCVGPDGSRRSSAARLLTGSLPPPGALRAAADGLRFEAAAPGRVISGGAFELAEAHATLAEALGPDLAPSLRPAFEWYACRGAFFHNDAHYAGVLFGVWCVAGPPRDIVFPRLGLRAGAEPGDWVVFDPFEPHAVLDPGERTYERARYVDARPSVFAGFEIEVNEASRLAFAIADSPRGVELSSRTRINAETGGIE